MIRQFTIVPALLAGAAMIISACSAEVGGGESSSSSSGANTSASSSESSQSSLGSSTSGDIKSFYSIEVSDEDRYEGRYLDKSGTLKSFDNIVYGTDQSVVANLSGIVKTGGNCAITENSDLYCWGDNEYGQLGNGTYESIDTGYYRDPQNTHKVTGIGKIRNVRSDGDSVCAINFDDEMYCWGQPLQYEMFGENINKVNTPQKVDENIFDFIYQWTASLDQFEYMTNDRQIRNFSRDYSTGDYSSTSYECQMFGNKFFCFRNYNLFTTKALYNEIKEFDQEFTHLVSFGDYHDYYEDKTPRNDWMQHFLGIDKDKNLWEISINKSGTTWVYDENLGYTVEVTLDLESSINIRKFDDHKYSDISKWGQTGLIFAIRDSGEVFLHASVGSSQSVSDTVIGGIGEKNIEVQYSSGFMKVPGIESAVSFPIKRGFYGYGWDYDNPKNPLNTFNLCVLTNDSKIQCWGTEDGIINIEL